MPWELTHWICGGYRAAREDGETVFIYRRPSWNSGPAGRRVFYELRSRGLLVGKITPGTSWGPRTRAEWLAAPDFALNETDLFEIASLLAPVP